MSDHRSNRAVFPIASRVRGVFLPHVVTIFLRTNLSQHIQAWREGYARWLKHVVNKKLDRVSDVAFSYK